MIRRIVSRAGRGQSVVEFALSLPFLVLLLAGVVDFANAYRVYVAMTNAAREGAFEVAKTGNETNMCVRVQESLSGTITISCSSPQDAVATYPGGCSAIGCPVRVTVSHSVPTFFGGIIGLGSIPMNATADMIILKGS